MRVLTRPVLLLLALTASLSAAASSPARASNPYGQEPYPVFWAVNGPNASAFAAGGSIDIAQYGIKTNNFTVCGGMTGSLMPSLSAEGVPTRGGVPQSSNFSLTAFLAGLSKTIATKIPDVHYDGLAVFDFEAFTPIWSEDTGAGGWHSKAYRVYSMKLVQQAHPSWARAKVEAEATKQFEAAATQLFVSALEQGKKLRPQALWGFYGMPYVHVGSDASKLLPIWQASTALFPSIYIASPSTAKLVVESTIALSIKMAEQAATPGKRRVPVYPFGWECYHNGSTLLSRPDAITDFIAPYNAGADGLVIWGDAGGNPKALSCMCDPQHNGPTNPSYFENIKQQTGPLVKTYLAKIAQCSTQHCSGHGRCNTVPSSDAAALLSQACTCYEGYSGDTCSEYM